MPSTDQLPFHSYRATKPILISCDCNSFPEASNDERKISKDFITPIFTSGDSTHFTSSVNSNLEKFSLDFSSLWLIDISLVFSILRKDYFQIFFNFKKVIQQSVWHGLRTEKLDPSWITDIKIAFSRVTKTSK